MPKQKKNWDILASEALEKEGKEKALADDPNVGGDAAVNSFFQQIYGSADEDTRRAMLKSYTESGGTSLSTDWKEVGYSVQYHFHRTNHVFLQVEKGKVCRVAFLRVLSINAFIG